MLNDMRTYFRGNSEGLSLLLPRTFSLQYPHKLGLQVLMISTYFASKIKRITINRKEAKQTMKKKQILLTPLAVTLAGTAVAFPVHEPYSAVKDTTKVIDIEEVIVIATPKENNRLRQQSVSSTSFSQSDMRSQSVTSVKSLSGLVPNLFIPDYGSKLTTSVYVRGIGSRINTPAVGLYVDNIPYVDKSAFDFNYSDIERIDVMRTAGYALRTQYHGRTHPCVYQVSFQLSGYRPATERGYLQRLQGFADALSPYLQPVCVLCRTVL
jgi:hypothetical protein